MGLTGYLGIGALIIMMGLGLVGYHYKVQAQTAIVERDAAVRDRDAAVAVNKRNEAAMAALEADKIKSDKLVTGLQDQIDTANQSTLDLANKLNELRATNASVNDYLNAVIPDDVLRVYDQSKAAGHH